MTHPKTRHVFFSPYEKLKRIHSKLTIKLIIIRSEILKKLMIHNKREKVIHENMKRNMINKNTIATKLRYKKHNNHDKL